MLKTKITGVSIALGSLILAACSQGPFALESLEGLQRGLASEDANDSNLTRLATDCNVNHDLPLLTHYDLKTQQFKLDGVDPVPQLANLNALIEYQSGVPYTFFWANQFIPGQGKALATNFDDQTFSDDEVKSVLRDVCRITGTAFHLRQPRTIITNRNSLKKSLKRIADGQVVHSLVFRENLFTIILPPKWNPQAAYKYPLFINGFYGLNANLIRQEGPSLMKLVAQSYSVDRRGAIGILWNGGGAAASFTTADQAYIDLNDFLKIAIPELNIAANRVITFGGSRGAYTALSIASHPKVSAINVKYVHAMNPFNDVKTIDELKGSTIFQLMSIGDQQSGYYGTWEKGFRMPDGTPPPTTDESVNLDRADKLQKLKANNTALKFFVGTHDFIVPTMVKMQLFETYLANGLNAEMSLFYLNGHTPDRHLRDQELLSVLLKTKNLKNSISLVTKGKVNSFLLDENGANQNLNLTQTNETPLIIEIPRYLNDNIKGHLFARGKPGSSYVLTFVNSVNERFELPFTLDQKGYVIRPLETLFLPYGELELESIKPMGASNSLKGFKTTLPLHTPLKMFHSSERTRSLQQTPWDLSIQSLRGNNEALALKLNGVAVGSNNGLVVFPDGTYVPPQLSIDQSCASETHCVVQTKAKISTQHIGKSGSLYAYVIGTAGRKNYYDGKGNWINEANLVDGKPIAFYTGPLKTVHIDSVAEGDLRGSVGLSIFFGYGLGTNAYTEMIDSGRFLQSVRSNNNQ
ncbi:MAG: hypothetical protein RJB66_540 [Pseudomonadota bacterium]|jgi:hypothetical protein